MSCGKRRRSVSVSNLLAGVDSPAPGGGPCLDSPGGPGALSGAGAGLSTPGATPARRRPGSPRIERRGGGRACRRPVQRGDGRPGGQDESGGHGGPGDRGGRDGEVGDGHASSAAGRNAAQRDRRWQRSRRARWDSDRLERSEVRDVDRLRPRDMQDQLAQQRRHRDRPDRRDPTRSIAARHRQPRDVGRSHRDRRAHDLGVLRPGRHSHRAVGRDDVARLVGDHLEVTARRERQLSASSARSPSSRSTRPRRRSRRPAARSCSTAR